MAAGYQDGISKRTGPQSVSACLSLGQSKSSGQAQGQHQRGIHKGINQPSMFHWDPPRKQSTTNVQGRKPLIRNVYNSDET